MSKELIERLRADAESTDDIGLCADAADRIEELERENNELAARIGKELNEENLALRAEIAELKGARLSAVLEDLQRDAERYRRLCWLVEFEEWCVGKSEIVDIYGVTKEEWMDDKAHMDAMLDRPDVVQDAESCQRALSSNAQHNRPASAGPG